MSYDICLECECPLIGDEKHFCDECRQEMLHVEDGLDPSDLYDCVPNHAAQEIVSTLNSHLNLMVYTLGQARMATRDFATDQDLTYTLFKDDDRFKYDSCKKAGTRKEDRK